MTLQISDRKVLLASIISGSYFMLLFCNLLVRINYTFASFVVELFTIPMLLIQGAIIGYVLHWIFIQKKKISFPIAAAGVISLVMVVLMITAT